MHRHAVRLWRPVGQASLMLQQRFLTLLVMRGEVVVKPVSQQAVQSVMQGEGAPGLDCPAGMQPEWGLWPCRTLQV